MSPRLRILFLAFLVEGGLAVLALIIGGLTGRDPWVPTGRAPLDGVATSVLQGLLFTVPPLGLFLWSVRSRWSPLLRIRELLRDSFMPLLAGSGPLELLLISLSAGVGEELLFRGVVQPELVAWLGGGVGFVLASVLFGLCHAVTVGYFVIATLIGAYLGWLMQHTDGLLAPIVTHAAYDFVALLLLQRQLSARRGAEPVVGP